MNDLWYHEYTHISQSIFLEAEAIHNNFNTVYWHQSLNIMSTSKTYLNVNINHTITCMCHQAQGLTQIQRENYDTIGQHQIKQLLSLYARFCIFFLSLQWMNKLILEWKHHLITFTSTITNTIIILLIDSTNRWNILHPIKACWTRQSMLKLLHKRDEESHYPSANKNSYSTPKSFSRSII